MRPAAAPGALVLGSAPASAAAEEAPGTTWWDLGLDHSEGCERTGQGDQQPPENSTHHSAKAVSNSTARLH